MQKKWVIKKNTRSTTSSINNIHPVLYTILKKRGLEDRRQIEYYLKGDISRLHDPLLLPDMKKAVCRILEAVKKKERIIVYGDYDVDGITSTALLIHYFKLAFNVEIDYYLPDRQKEGYGLNLEAIKKLIKEGYQLVVTVDCGISALEEVAYANSHELDFIITDHHQVGTQIPHAVAVVDPHRIDCNYPYQELAGVGVAFKLCQALENETTGTIISSRLLELLDIVTLGTVADLVPLRGENRLLVKEGLKRLEASNKPGIRALISQSGLEEKEINSGHIGYILAPPINASGRLSNPEMGLRLLLTQDTKEAVEIATELVKINRERQQLEEEIFLDAVNKVENECDLDKEKVIILASEEWHQGVIGIVASRLVEKFYRPTILIALEEGVGKASCRSIKGLNMYQALKETSGYLEGFGGHAMAAGLEIKKEYISKFKREFNKYLEEKLSVDDLIPVLEIDAAINLEDIDEKLMSGLERLKPFGIDNPRPRFLLPDIKPKGIYYCGKNNNHLRVILKNGLSGIGFGLGTRKINPKGEKMDLAFTLEYNEWKGQRKIQLKLEDINLREDPLDFPVIYEADEFRIADKRGLNKYQEYIKDLISRKHKVAVFINNLKLYKVFKREVKAREPIFLATEEKGVKDFISATKGVIFFTKSSQIKNIEADDLIFLSLPFSLTEMDKILKSIISLETIHLLYGEEQININKKILKERLPSDNYLRRFYFYLKSMPDRKIKYSKIKNEWPEYNRFLIKHSLSILEELNLIKYKEPYIELIPFNGKGLDLSDSLSYNENIGIIKGFRRLRKVVLKEDPFQLLDKIKGDLKEEVS